MNDKKITIHAHYIQSIATIKIQHALRYKAAVLNLPLFKHADRLETTDS